MSAMYLIILIQSKLATINETFKQQGLALSGTLSVLNKLKLTLLRSTKKLDS